LHPHASSTILVALASPTSAANLAQALARHALACFTAGHQSRLSCLNGRAPGLQQAAAMAFDDILNKDSTLDKQLAEILQN